jgi:hypothetical protein
MIVKLNSSEDSKKDYRKWWYCKDYNQRVCSEMCGNRLCSFKCKLYEENTVQEWEENNNGI